LQSVILLAVIRRWFHLSMDISVRWRAEVLPTPVSRLCARAYKNDIKTNKHEQHNFGYLSYIRRILIEKCRTTLMRKTSA